MAAGDESGLSGNQAGPVASPIFNVTFRSFFGPRINQESVVSLSGRRKKAAYAANKRRFGWIGATTLVFTILSGLAFFPSALSVPGVMDVLHPKQPMSTMPPSAQMAVIPFVATADDTIPQIDIDRFCREMAEISGQDAQPANLSGCVTSERQAESRLRSASFRAGILGTCKGRFASGGAGQISYIRLWMCAADIRLSEAKQ